MLQKEDGRRLGWALIILSFAILIGSLTNNLNSITGYYAYDRGTIGTETVNLYVDDKVSYSGCSGYTMSGVSGPECSANVNVDNCIVNAVSTGTCTAQFTPDFATYYTITLNIGTTQIAANQDDVSSPDGDISVAYSLPREGLVGENVG